jgi:hypothetical protein
MSGDGINAAVRKATWIRWMGEEVGQGKCWCCGLATIHPLNFSCGHVVSRAHGGLAVVGNLRPICVTCNSSCGAENMKAFALKCGFTGKIISEEDSEVKEEKKASGGIQLEEILVFRDEVKCQGRCGGWYKEKTLKKYGGAYCKKCFYDLYVDPVLKSI